MDMILEFIFEIVFEGILELATNKRIAKWVRYPLLTLIILAYLALIIFFSWIAYILLEKTIVGSLLMALLVIALLAMGIKFYRQRIK